jgi:hypothetical protein
MVVTLRHPERANGAEGAGEDAMNLSSPSSCIAQHALSEAEGTLQDLGDDGRSLRRRSSHFEILRCLRSAG